MNNNMKSMTDNELLVVNGGGDTADTVAVIISNLNPYKILHDFGHDVVYPYIWKPVKSLFS